MDEWPITFSLPQGWTVGGLTTWAAQLAEALAEGGRLVRLVLHQPPAGYELLDSELLPTHKNICVIHAPALAKPQQWQACLSCYRELLPTVLLPSVLAESYAIAAALTTVHPDKLRVLAWSHSDNGYDYAYLTYYEPIVHRYVANTRECEAQLSLRVATRSADVAFIPHGVRLPEYRVRPCGHDNPLRLVYGGRMDHLVKRVLDFPRLARRLDERGVHFEMRLIGDGPQSRRLSAEVAEITSTFRRRDNVIRKEPPRPWFDMQEIWSWADISMLMSTHEGLSVAMLEAMAAGCVPVVSRVASGADEIIKSGENGFLFPIGDLEAMAEHIAWLAQNKSALQWMSEAARRAMSECFQYEAFFEKVNEVLNDLQDAAPCAWPPGRPLQMNSDNLLGDFAFSATIPAVAPDRLRKLLDNLARDGHEPIAIYGAGRHTRGLASVWADSSARICAVVDDDPARHGTRLWGWPIVAPEHVASVGATTIVLSSWLHEDVMWRRRDYFEKMGLRVFRLYDEALLGKSSDSPEYTTV